MDQLELQDLDYIWDQLHMYGGRLVSTLLRSSITTYCWGRDNGCGRRKDRTIHMGCITSRILPCHVKRVSLIWLDWKWLRRPDLNQNGYDWTL